MNHLRELIGSIEPTQTRWSGTYGRATMSSLLARAEQVIFDDLLSNREVSDAAGARRMLAELHAADNPKTGILFDDYVTTLRNLQTPDTFALELTDLMREVAESSNPEAVLREIVAHERASGLVTEQNILPEDFWTRPSVEAPEISASVARFRGEFVDDPKPSLLERARYTLFGEKADPPTVPTGVEPPIPFEGPVASAEPTVGWDLRLRDYNRIQEYFSSERVYSDLSLDQQQMVESFRYTPDEFNSKFDTTYDSARYHELREQLRAELLDELSQGEMNSFVGIEESFAVSAEEFGLHFAASQGAAQVRKNNRMWRIIGAGPLMIFA